MTVDLQLQRLYDRVHLVRGKGDRQSGGLCIITFLALLAGERHTDAPSTASPLVCQFALTLNDAMPDTERQRLKPFAPRILGTADGFDPGRAAVLRRAMQQGVFPRICGDLQEKVPPFGPLHDPGGAHPLHTAQELISGFAAAAAGEDTPRNRRQIAMLAARLLSTCAAAASNSTGREWYWAQAISLLDQFCDIGMPLMRRGLTPARVERLLEADSLHSGSTGFLADALRRLGRTVAAGIGIAAATTQSPVLTPIAGHRRRPAPSAWGTKSSHCSFQEPDMPKAFIPSPTKAG